LASRGPARFGRQRPAVLDPPHAPDEHGPRPARSSRTATSARADGPAGGRTRARLTRRRSAYGAGMANATWTWRPLTTGDAPALARVNAAVEAVDRTGEHFSEQDIRDELEDEVIDLERDSLAALDADGDLVAYARVHARADVRDVDRVRADGAVVPAARGRGL